MSDLKTLLATGDDHMRAGRPAEAQQAFRAAWPLSKGVFDDAQRVWLLLALANAGLRAGDCDDAFEACSGAQNGFAKSSRVVAGNPLFHLLAGLAAHGIGEEKIATDNLARALICGGPAIFTGEDPTHLARMKQLLNPPAELGTWDGYEGSSRDLLNGASGYLAELLASRLGAPPPYTYPDS